jgi:23S rRNA (uracil1939-C5)-methyltransferase
LHPRTSPTFEPSLKRSTPETKQAVVEKLVSGGDGMVREEGLVVFIPGVLPGEQIVYRSGPVKKGFARGTLLKILVPSPDRRVPPCPLYGRCGGCDFMHLTDEAQSRAKALLVQEAFRRLGKKEIELPALVTGPVWAYRARLQLHKDGPRSPAGFKARGSDRTVPVSDCPVAAPGFKDLLASAGRDLPAGRSNAFAVGEEAYVEGRDSQVTIEVGGKRLVSSLDGFFQSNLSLLPELVAAVLDALPPKGTRVLDLYGGSGLFGAFLADRYDTVVEVEQNSAALSLARINVRGPLHEFHRSTLEDWVARRPKNPPALDGIVVDPPRTGLSPEVAGFLASGPAAVLAYVSCNPDTLARDTRTLENSGWTMTGIKLFDFYPQTTHVEAVARFVRS